MADLHHLQYIRIMGSINAGSCWSEIKQSPFCPVALAQESMPHYHQHQAHLGAHTAWCSLLVTSCTSTRISTSAVACRSKGCMPCRSSSWWSGVLRVSLWAVLLSRHWPAAILQLRACKLWKSWPRSCGALCLKLAAAELFWAKPAAGQRVNGVFHDSSILLPAVSNHLDNPSMTSRPQRACKSMIATWAFLHQRECRDIYIC